MTERLAQVQGQLPAGAIPALAPDSPATGQIFWYTVEGGGLDLGRLRAIQDWFVRPQLGSVPGVAEVSSVGGFPIEYEVAPDCDRLRLFGVTLRDLLQAVSSSNAATAGHVVNKGNAEYVVRGVGWLGASPKPGDESFDRGAPFAISRTLSSPWREGRSGWPKWPRWRLCRAFAAGRSRRMAAKSSAAWSS